MNSLPEGGLRPLELETEAQPPVNRRWVRVEQARNVARSQPMAQRRGGGLDPSPNPAITSFASDEFCDPELRHALITADELLEGQPSAGVLDQMPVNRGWLRFLIG